MKINHASTMLNAIERLHGDVAEYKIREGKSLPCSVWVASTKQNINANLPEENFFLFSFFSPLLLSWARAERVTLRIFVEGTSEDAA